MHRAGLAPGKVCKGRGGIVSNGTRWEAEKSSVRTLSDARRDLLQVEKTEGLESQRGDFRSTIPPDSSP